MKLFPSCFSFLSLILSSSQEMMTPVVMVVPQPTTWQPRAGCVLRPAHCPGCVAGAYADYPFFLLFPRAFARSLARSFAEIFPHETLLLLLLLLLLLGEKPTDIGDARLRGLFFLLRRLNWILRRHGVQSDTCVVRFSVSQSVPCLSCPCCFHSRLLGLSPLLNVIDDVEVGLSFVLLSCQKD
ncbi:hypothetical protein JOL62DRAFT_155354 [Phyllosticta paracitricarpa]|uniref:Secreted protein n=1 Tax=Phyllosticta paracitricarpa TaxID=2016321 RepID=A0ABR1N4C4_9PEZI